MKKLFVNIIFLHIFNNLCAQYFENIAPTQGIEHTVITQLQFGGHGVSFFDFDNDGWDDITFIQESDSVLLFKNNNGIFEQIPSVAFQVGQIRQALWVDYDNDGDNDLFVTSTNGFSRLYQNDGNFIFTDVTVAAGISTAVANNFGVSFADYDRDGHLDFYLARYQMSGDTLNPAHVNVLYHNNGNGTFTDVTTLLGVGDSIQPSFMGAWIDVDRNGWPDLFVINDRVLWGNTLFMNNGDGTFSDFTVQSGLEMFGQDPMGVTFDDFDNDGDIDIILSNGGPPTKPVRFYVNQGDSTFNEVAQNYGIDVPVTFMCTWGGSWFDAENDGFLDLYLTTGFLIQATGEVRNYFFRSNQAALFADSPFAFLGDHVAASYSVAKGDIDNDGLADLVVQNAKNYNSFIWKNNFGQASNNNYLKLTLNGTVSNKMAIGSWINVYAQNNLYSYYTRCGESFISQDSQHHIFGLASAEIVDSIVVEYPSGIIDHYYNVLVNQSLTLIEGETLTFNILNLTNQNAICAGSQISISAPLFSSYLWNTGETTQSIVVNQAGQYFLSALNNQGFVYQSDTINISIVDEVYISHEIEDVLCYGQLSGTVNLTIFNANPDYSLIWSNGETGLYQNNLGAGAYEYNYSDALGCEFSGSITINQGNEILLFSETTNQTTFESGTLQLMALGGTPPFQILVNGNAMPSNPMDVDSGFYSVTVTDANGCFYEESITIGFVDFSSVDAFDLKNMFFYPNPVSDKMLFLKGITLENIVDVKDALGRQFHYAQCASDQCIELLNVSSGAIFITVQVGDYTHVFKVMVIE